MNWLAYIGVGKTKPAKQSTLQPKEELHKKSGSAPSAQSIVQRSRLNTSSLRSRKIQTILSGGGNRVECQLLRQNRRDMVQDRLHQDKDKTATYQSGMPTSKKAGLEILSGIDLSKVRVHYISSRPAQVNASAYTQRPDIHLAAGKKKHLPHEGWYVVQQMRGRVNPTMQSQGVSINDDSNLECEAEVKGSRTVTMQASVQTNAAAKKSANGSIRDSTVQRYVTYTQADQSI